MRHSGFWAFPLLITGFAVAARPVTQEIEIIERSPVEITLTFGNICGAYPALSHQFSAADDRLVVTYAVKDSPCAADEKPRSVSFISTVDVEREAALLGMKTKKPTLRVVAP